MLLRVASGMAPPCVEKVAGLVRRIILLVFGCITSPFSCWVTGWRPGVSVIHADARRKDHRIRFGLHPSSGKSLGAPLIPACSLWKPAGRDACAPRDHQTWFGLHLSN